MLLSRFWYLFLAVSAAAALAAALLGRGIVNRLSDKQVADQLRRDRTELEAMLQLEARSRLDRISFIMVDSKVGAILKRAAGIDDVSKLYKLNTELKQLLKGHVERIIEATPGSDSPQDKRNRVTPTIGFAVDARGRIIAQMGPMAANPPGSSLADYPLVKRALQGYVRDDVWLYDRKVYRMAARPVFSTGQYVGAVLHGYRYDPPFVQMLSKHLGGASVTFFYGTQVMGTYTPTDREDAPTHAQMVAPLREVFNDEKFKSGKRTDPVQLEGGGLAVYSLLTGSAAASQVGYVIARPRQHLSSPMEMFEGATEDDVKGLPIAFLVGGAVVAFLFGLLFIYLERDRNFKQILDKTAEIARDERDRLIITEWRGSYRKLADVINQAIDREVEKAAEMAPSSRKKVDLDEILGPTPEAEGADSFFGFAGDKPAGGPDLVPPPPATEAPVPAAPPSRPEAPAPPSQPDAAAPASQAPASQPGAAAEEFDEQSHFEEVFEQYLATRKECGEPTEGLSLDKFLITLKKNRDQIISKHGARAVRFTVYVKNGKAALKASPIKK
jgi:hypothetical protein